MELRGLQVLDLFAGSGALGLEALSRGAAHATFVETGGDALRTIRANAADLGVVDRITIRRMDVFRFLERAAGSFGLAFADPPYDLPGIELLPDLVLPRLEGSPPGLFVLEHDARHGFKNHDALLTTRIYGGTGVSVFGVGNA
jgi:16S rRNA (guanine966-N2)-methyltransferase